MSKTRTGRNEYEQECSGDPAQGESMKMGLDEGVVEEERLKLAGNLLCLAHNLLTFIIICI